MGRNTEIARSAPSGGRNRPAKLSIFRTEKCKFPTAANRELNRPISELKSAIRDLNRPGRQRATARGRGVGSRTRLDAEALGRDIRDMRATDRILVVTTTSTRDGGAPGGCAR